MKNSNIKVSVTVPVYNTSKYLRKCLDSLASQTLKDIEIIIVDDGSTDNSGDICDEYASRYSNFKVIHQKNGGLAVARQTGLDAARGEYVIVCDSDDWTEPDMYEKLYEEAVRSGADMVMCGYIAEYSDGKSNPSQVIFKEENGKIDNNDFLRRGVGNSWVKLIKRSLFTEYDISYERDINLGEDILISLKLLKANPSIVQIPYFLYHYRRLFGENTYTNRIDNKALQQLYTKYKWIKKNYSKKEYNDLKNIYATSIIVSSLRSKDIDINQYRDFVKNELSWQIIFSGHHYGKMAINVLAKVLSYHQLKSLFGLIYKYVYK